MMLMDQARKQRGNAPEGERSGGGDLKQPDWRQFTPPELMDAVERIVAAGVKMMYAPEMRQELQEAVASDMPIDEKLADNTSGLLLLLDQKSQGGLPVGAIFPAGMALLGEAADVLQAAGQTVTQEDFNDAALRMYVVMGKKLGGSDEQIMQGAQQALGGQGDAPPDAAAATVPQPPGPTAPAAPGAEAMPPAEDEEAAMARGMA